MNEVLHNVWQLEVPLEGSPLRGIHCYLIKGGPRHLLVDTAFNTDVCEAALLEQMDALGVRLPDTDIFLTHLHVDHSGLAARLKRPENTLFCSAEDRTRIDGFQQPEHWGWLTRSNTWGGVPPQDALQPTQHVAYHNRPACVVPIEAVAPGDVLHYGGYALTVTSLTGHTPGQMGLWEPAGRTLFCADHILGKVSPNITTWDLDTDYVALFCENLRKVRAMQPATLLAAHGAPIATPAARIDELLAHHAHRLDMMEALARGHGGPVTAYEVAVQVEWSSGKGFPSLPIQQKWFAVSETLAHLQALAAAGRLQRTLRDDGALLYCCMPETPRRPPTKKPPLP